MQRFFRMFVLIEAGEGKMTSNSHSSRALKRASNLKSFVTGRLRTAAGSSDSAERISSKMAAMRSLSILPTFRTASASFGLPANALSNLSAPASSGQLSKCGESCEILWLVTPSCLFCRSAVFPSILWHTGFHNTHT